jgi:hypothetical protein
MCLKLSENNLKMLAQVAQVAQTRISCCKSVTYFVPRNQKFLARNYFAGTNMSQAASHSVVGLEPRIVFRESSSCVVGIPPSVAKLFHGLSPYVVDDTKKPEPRGAGRVS